MRIFYFIILETKAGYVYASSFHNQGIVIQHLFFSESSVDFLQFTLCDVHSANRCKGNGICIID